MPHAKVKVTHTPEEGGDRGGGGREGEDCLSCFPLVSVLSRQPCRMCKIVLKSLSQCGCFRLKRLTSFSAVRVGCGGEAVGLQCDGGPAVCCPSECQYILTHCMHIMLGDVVGLQCPSHDSSIFLPYCQHPPYHPPTYPPSPPRFSTLTSGQKCGSHACKIVSLNIVLGTEPSITEKTKSCLSPVLWAIN